jgi:hypothetical protein
MHDATAFHVRRAKPAARPLNAPAAQAAMTALLRSSRAGMKEPVWAECSAVAHTACVSTLGEWRQRGPLLCLSVLHVRTCVGEGEGSRAGAVSAAEFRSTWRGVSCITWLACERVGRPW